MAARGTGATGASEMREEERREENNEVEIN